MRKRIRVANPASGPGWTSKQRAKRYLSQGRAEWVEHGVSIRFTEDHRAKSAQRSADKTASEYTIASRTGMAQFTAVANLPMIRPGVLLNFGRRKGASRSIFQAAA